MKISNMTIIAMSAFFAFGCGDTAKVSQNTASDTRPAVATPTASAATPLDELALGRDIYNQYCAACHKEDGTGGKMTIEGKTLDVDDLTSEKIKKFSDDKITSYIHNGIEDEGMPAFKDKLSEAQIREVVRFVRGGIQMMDMKKP